MKRHDEPRFIRVPRKTGIGCLRCTTASHRVEQRVPLYPDAFIGLCIVIGQCTINNACQVNIRTRSDLCTCCLCTALRVSDRASLGEMSNQERSLLDHTISTKVGLFPTSDNFTPLTQRRVDEHGVEARALKIPPTPLENLRSQLLARKMRSLERLSWRARRS